MENSPYFKERSGLEGMLHFSRALLADKKGDAAAFEREMKDAFWASPEESNIFAETLRGIRTKARMSQLTLPMNLEIQTAGGEKTTLAALAKGKKAVLLDFWASWCGPCMRSLPGLRERAEKLPPQGVAVAGMNTEGSAEIAAKIKKENKMEMPWLVEPKDQPFSGPLQIESIPRAVLVSPEGKALFNGHPNDSGLAEALAKLGVKLPEEK